MNRTAGPRRVELLAVHGLPEVVPGDDLPALVLASLREAGLRLADGDILVVASKVVAKAEGRYLHDADGIPLDAESATASQTERVVAERLTPRGLARIVSSRSGPVLAAAGVDASNLPPGSAPLALPADPDASARAMRAALIAGTDDEDPLRLAVLVTDTLGRPWRVGQTDAAIGAAGLIVAEDLGGRPDGHGRTMEVTVRALADEIAAAADLVKGKTDGVPLALVRGLSHLVTREPTPGAASLIRPEDEDWFRYGHAEAARASIGLEPGDERVGAQPVRPPAPARRLARAVEVAQAAQDVCGATPATISTDGDRALAALVTPGEVTPAGWVGAGALAQRIVVAAWAEGLATVIEAAGPVGVTVRVLPTD